MAAFTLVDTSIFAGPLDAASFGNAVALKLDGDTVDATVFTSGGWRVFIPNGFQSWEATFAGPQDLAATTAANTHTPDELYQLTLGQAYPLMFVPQGAAEGSVAFAGNGQLNAYSPFGGAVGELAEHEVMFGPSANSPLVRGVHATRQTVTATGNGTGHNLGAVSAAQRLYAGVHFLTAGGTTPSITVVVESDDNSGFTTPTTRITFGAATARSAQWSSAAGAITDTWWRMRWTVTGTSPSFQVRGFLGII